MRLSLMRFGSKGIGLLCLAIVIIGIAALLPAPKTGASAWQLTAHPIGKAQSCVLMFKNSEGEMLNVLNNGFDCERFVAESKYELEFERVNRNTLSINILTGFKPFLSNYTVVKRVLSFMSVLALLSTTIMMILAVFWSRKVIASCRKSPIVDAKITAIVADGRSNIFRDHFCLKWRTRGGERGQSLARPYWLTRQYRVGDTIKVYQSKTKTYWVLDVGLGPQSTSGVPVVMRSNSPADRPE